MQISVFDLAGPIMVGPSSSHTAGACKIGQIARAIFHATPTEVDFYLYGSFATVYQGHSTDKALLAGVMKFQTSDPRLVDAFEYAKKEGIKYKFIPVEIETDHHPNTVRIILKNATSHLSVVGSSIGGGKVIITYINDVPVDLEMMSGRFFSLLVGTNKRSNNALEKVKERLKEWKIPVADEQAICSIKGKCMTALNILDYYLKLPQVLELEKIAGVDFVRSLTKLLK